MSDGAEAPTERSEKRRPDDHTSEVAPGIFRIMLPIDLPGLGHVNCYAIPDAEGLALIDPGLADGVTHDVLRARLADADFDIARVHTVVTTHSHFDHYGGVARLRAADVEVRTVGHRRFGVGWREAYNDVLADEDSGSLVERTDDELEALAGRLIREAPWGGSTDPFPAELLAAWGEGIDVVDVLRPPEITDVVDDLDSIQLGGRPWTVLHTPGHADDHICLWNEELGVFFSGDHVLPTITPHISGFSSYESSLDAFFGSLERVGELGSATVVLPAHGDPFTDLAGRVTDIRRHHDERLDRVVTIGAEIGRKPVGAYMRLLFRERSWGTMAASETYAHLEWLRLHGRIRRDEIEGRPVYEI